VVDDYTKYIYPGKMHEYLASGHPVVSAPVRSVQEFKDVIAIANSTTEWSKAIASSLSAGENTPERRVARQSVAREYDWERLVDRMAHTIAARLDLMRADAPGEVESGLDSALSAPR